MVDRLTGSLQKMGRRTDDIGKDWGQYANYVEMTEQVACRFANFTLITAWKSLGDPSLKAAF